MNLIPWDCQPQEVAPIDPRMIEAGLVAVFMQVNGEFRDVLNGVAATTNTTTRAAAPQGQVADFATGQKAVFADRAEYRLTGALTIIAAAVVRSYSNYTHLLSKNGTTAGDNTPIEFRHNSPTGTELLSLRASASTYSMWQSSGATTAVGYRVNALTYPSGSLSAQPRMWQNGVELSVSNVVSNTGTVSDNGQPLYVGMRQDNVTQFDGQEAIIVLFNREISDELNLELQAAPWRVFEPQYIATVIAAGGATQFLTLSAAVTAGASIARDVAAIKAAAAAASAAIAKAASTSKAAAVAATASRVLQAQATRSASTSVTAGLSKMTGLARSASTTCSAALSQVKVKLLTLAASVTASASVVRAVSATRSAATTAGAALAKQARVIRSASSSAAAAVLKTAGLVRAASSTAGAALATTKVRLLTLAAAVTTSASVTRAVSATRAASLTVGANLTKLVRITRSAGATLLATLARVLIGGGGLAAATPGFIAKLAKRTWKATMATKRSWVAKWNGDR